MTEPTTDQPPLTRRSHPGRTASKPLPPEGRAVRVHLAARGQDQRWLAQQLGITGMSVSRMLERMSPRDLERVAAVLEVSPMDLARGVVRLRITANGVDTRWYAPPNGTSK